MNKPKMPTPAEFRAAAAALVVRGWQEIATVMADDAKKDGVTNFGRLFRRGADRFYLNYKTIGALPA